MCMYSDMTTSIEKTINTIVAGIKDMQVAG